MKNSAGKGLSTVNPTAPMKTPEVATAKMPAESDWEAESHHRTLMEAEHIKADPVKMQKVRQIAGRKLNAATAIKSIADIKKAGKALRVKSKAAADATSTPKAFPGGDNDGEDYHRTLEKAEMIKSDPKKMAKVKTVAAAKMAAAGNVHGMVNDYDEDDK